MKTPLLTAGCIALSIMVTPALADPAAELEIALGNFLTQPNYTWGAPGQAAATDAALGRGQHEKGGFTKIQLMNGPHILQEEKPLAKARAAITDEETYISERWVFETSAGWKSLQELPTQASIGARRPPRAFPAGATNRSFGTRRPDHEVVFMLKYIARVEALGDGVYRAVFTGDCAHEMIAGPRPQYSRVPMPQLEGASASAKLWVKAGMLVRYELEVAATRVTPTGARFPITMKVPRELTNIGTTVIDVPAEVRAKLGR